MSVESPFVANTGDDRREPPVLPLGAMVEREDYRAGGAAGDCGLKRARRVCQRESRPNVE